jgi:hypothetical protein
MTFPAIRLPFFASRPGATAPRETAETSGDADLRREYVQRLLSCDACVGEYGVQALMGLFPKDF